jgi:comEA protein
MEKKEDKKQAFLENAKYIAIGALAVAILAGSGVLYWQIQKQNNPPKDESVASNELKSQVSDLNKKIDDLNIALKDAQTVVTSESTVKTTTKSSAAVAGASTSSNEVSGKVNLNTASLSQLDTLTGIGATYAQRIIDYRNANGGFKTIDEIQNVKGIGPKTFEKMKDQITV